MVCADLHLEAIRRSGERDGHQAGVVDEHVDAWRYIHHGSGGFPDATEIGEVKPDEMVFGAGAGRPHPVEGFPAGRLIAAGQDDSSSCPGEYGGRL